MDQHVLATHNVLQDKRQGLTGPFSSPELAHPHISWHISRFCMTCGDYIICFGPNLWMEMSQSSLSLPNGHSGTISSVSWPHGHGKGSHMEPSKITQSDLSDLSDLE